MSSKKHLVVGFVTPLLVIAAGAFFILGDNETAENNQSVNEAKKKLVEEFQGAYAKDAVSNGRIVEYDIIARESEVELYDGVKTRVWAYNGIVPGPVLVADLGDTVRVNFKNNLPQETTIHWHGVRVPNAMDGVPGVNQDSIKPGETFVYEFTPKDAGTFWYHPHVRGSEQVERGLYGALIVRDDNDYQFDQDITWVLDDWRLLNSGQIDSRFNIGHDLMHDGRWGNIISVNGSLQQSLSIKPGERVRLRIINSSNGRIYKLDFGSLDAQVIAVDGMDVGKSFNPAEFDFAPGNRLDVDLTAPSSLAGSSGIIKDTYQGQSNILSEVSVSSEIATVNDFIYSKDVLIPSWQDAGKLNSDITYNLHSAMGGPLGVKWMINGKSYPDMDIFSLKNGEFNKIKFVNNSFNLHPMHLHGQFFKVLSRNGEPSDEEFFRDTVLVKSQEVVEIGLVPLDKGLWAKHCHILEHAEAGMMTVFEVI